MLAPATDAAGAQALGVRIAGALGEALMPRTHPRESFRAGYCAVANMGYYPTDPVALLARASDAAHRGRLVPDHPWMRRFDAAASEHQ